jgi:peptidoglycan/LPS O-acetylase OafA/YrhL
MPQLDGLRALAVFAVFIHHTPLGERSPIPLGGLGVRLFFVLSGFLITSILLNCRAAIEEEQVGLWFVARQFYVRRFLRIFPLYYFVILCLVVVDFEHARSSWLWLVTYTTNILFAWRGEWTAFGHFWSLSVEEHYYLIWPWLVLCLPRRQLAPMTLAVILVGPLYKFCAVAWEFNDIATFCATPACLDTLGLGSLLAMYKHDRLGNGMPDLALVRFAGVSGLAMLVALFSTVLFDPAWRIGTIFQDVALGLVFVDLVHRAGTGLGGIGGVVLASRPMVFLGKISYGLYVYHVFAPYMLQGVAQSVGWDAGQLGVWGWCVVGALTVAVATASWFCFEQPLNNLKRYFPYSGGVPTRGTDRHVS